MIAIVDPRMGELRAMPPIQTKATLPEQRTARWGNRKLWRGSGISRAWLIAHSSGRGQDMEWPS